jgi:large subunit ribosomal protein L2
MFIKTLKPTTPSNRHKKSIKKISSYDRKYSRLLTLLKKNHAGRNNTGRITVRHRGGGHKRIFRSIDSNRTLINSVNTVVRIEYDPNRSSLVALNLSTLGYFYYTLLTEDKKVGDIFISVWSIIDSDLFLHKYSNEGSSMPLIIVPLTSKIHSIESIPSKGSQLIKSAGTYGILIQKYTNGYALVKLPSGEYKFISIFSMGTIGRVSNKKHKQVILGKAGTSR